MAVASRHGNLAGENNGIRAKPVLSLRERAEAAVGAKPAEVDRMPAEEVQALLHELQVHQIELEMQNAELHRAQEELARSRDYLAFLYETAAVGCLTFDEHGVVVEANLTLAAMLGVERGRLVGARFTSFVSPDSQDTLYLHGRAVLASGQQQKCELALRRPDASEFPVILNSLRVRDPATLAFHWRAAVTDITDRARAEAALRSSEEQHRLLFELNPNPMWIIDEATLRFLAVNEAAVQLYGWSRAELLRMTVMEVRPPGERAKLAASLAAQRGSRAAFVGEWRHWRKDRSVLDVEVTVSGIQFQGRDARLAALKDISARKRAEVRLSQLNATLEERVAERTAALSRANDSLQASEQVLADFFGKAPVGLLWVVPDGRIQRANRALAAILRCRLEALSGREVAEFCADPEAGPALVGRLARNETLHDHLARLRRQDGSMVHVLIDANGLWERGKLVRSRWFVRDVSRRMELQQEILAIGERVRQRIGQDLHDDLCQRLAGIEFLSWALARELRGSSRPRAAEAVEIAKVARETLANARGVSHSMAPMELERDGLAEALEHLAARTRRLFRIDCRFRGEAGATMADPAARIHLYRIAQEAINNAIKHAKARRIDVGLRAKGSQLLLRVRDDGVGLPRKPRRNAGLGLRIMEYRLQALGGSLALGGGRNGGTVLVCSVPKALSRPGTEGRR